MVAAQSDQVFAIEPDLSQFLADFPGTRADALRHWSSQMRTRLGMRLCTKHDLAPNKSLYLVYPGRIADEHTPLGAFSQEIQLATKPISGADSGDPVVFFSYPEEPWRGSDTRPLETFVDPYRDVDPERIDCFSHVEVWIKPS